MTLSLGNKELAVMTIIFLLLSVLCRFIIGIYMNLLLKEAENMAVTGHKYLQQCKQRFRNIYKLNDGVPNIPVFVDRMMEKISIGRFSVEGIAHMSGQLMLLSVLTAGLAACMQIASGKTFFETVPYYLLCFLGLYVYFSVSGLVDLDGKYRKLKINLTDYLENHMAPRLAVMAAANAALGNDPVPQEQEMMDKLQETGTAEELEELLKEFFA